MRIRKGAVLFWLAALLPPGVLKSQDLEWRVLSDSTVEIRKGADGMYFAEGDVLGAQGEKLVHFNLQIRALLATDEDFRELYTELETLDFRKKPKYTWEDVQAGRATMRQWATDPNNPRSTQKGSFSLPAPNYVQLAASRNLAPLVPLFDADELRIRVAFIDAETGADKSLYNVLRTRVLIEQRDW